MATAVNADEQPLHLRQETERLRQENAELRRHISQHSAVDTAGTRNAERQHSSADTDRAKFSWHPKALFTTVFTAVWVAVMVANIIDDPRSTFAVVRHEHTCLYGDV